MAITFERVEEIRATLEAHSEEIPPGNRVGPWRGEYQIDATRRCIANPYVAYKGTVQFTGKTFTASLIACARLLEGQRGLVAFPTLRQGGRIIADRIADWMGVLCKVHGIKQRMPFGEHEKNWSNGAKLTALSTDEKARAGIQGYTFEFAIVDEAHEPFAADLAGPLFSRTDIAAMRGEAMILLIGVGGNKDSLMEYCIDAKQDGEHIFHTIHVRPDVIIRDVPEADAQLKRQRALVTDREWRKYYECERDDISGRQMYSQILASVPTSEAARYACGIDVGKRQDRTVAMLVSAAPHTGKPGQVITIEETLELPLRASNDEMAADIAAWLEPRGIPGSQVCVELNGPGYGLHESLIKYIPTANGIYLTDNETNTGLKSQIIYDLQVDAQDGRLCCRDEYVREHLLKLRTGIAGSDMAADATLTRHETLYKGRQVFEHSDYNSALIMARMMLG